MNRKNLVTLVHSLIISKVDYCNSLFTGLPNVILKKVQSVLNRAARLILNLPPRVPTTSSLIELHWLPLKAIIEFKIWVCEMQITLTVYMNVELLERGICQLLFFLHCPAFI